MNNLAKSAASWKTTLVGFLTGAALIINQAVSYFDNDPSTIFSWEQFTAGLGALGIGFFSRDSDKSSEQVGAR